MAERAIAGAPMASGICTVLASFTLNDAAVLTGIIITVATFAMNAWFQWDKRQRELKQSKE